ncbi:efflux RND transporter periplasmic adaptor subunit [Polycladidibacter hongkongensis]|uniref:efflux RND transporter periplasmic adaptor subunit n=1 Tax=Polycladidibacter hongkongensis TaxID=1647556 RepID=UPI00082E73B8|nr:efflux RND transporter periplasmic adaptor subunit [Pseudovibrio hongkongensis]
MGIRFSHLLALGIAGSAALWMASGTVVQSGQGENEGSTPPPAQRNAEQAAKPFSVRVTEFKAIERQPVLEMRGRTEADAKVEVRAETSGIVAKRPAFEGARVKPGELLCVLDRGAREARVLQANAKLAQAELNYEASTKLSGKGYAAKNKLAAEKASRDAAKAALQEAEIELARTEIRSPIAGIVEAPLVEEGAMLTIGQTCAKVVNPDPMLVVGAVSEGDVKKVALGQKAIINLVGNEQVLGDVRYVAQSSDPDTRTFRIELAVDNSERKLRDGMTAVAMLQLPQEHAHYISPGILTLDDQGRVGVRAVNSDNLVVFYEVQLIGGDTKGVWVNGLPDSVNIITVGQDYVGEGQKVTPVPYAAESNS